MKRAKLKKYAKTAVLTVALLTLSAMTAISVCASSQDSNQTEQGPGFQNESHTAPKEQLSSQIYLYGETHAQEKIIEKEYEIWYQYYHEDGLRHLFIEAPYYTAEFLNLWMKSDSDEFLDLVYDDWQGTAAHNPYLKEFYQKIKRDCPETVFHGTDVGHQYETTGQQYLKYLEENNLENSEQYRIAEETIEQGKYFYTQSADAYRENKMTENFAREFEALDGESVMGIYGAAHIGIDAMDFSTRSVPSMANQLHTAYEDALHTEDLSWIAKDVEPQRIDTIKVAGKEYQAAYFGKEDITGFQDFAFREFWRLENAYDDFKDRPKADNVLPYNNYPMLVSQGQVFMLDYVKTDGSVSRMYFRSAGNDWEGMQSTDEFIVD